MEKSEILKAVENMLNNSDNVNTKISFDDIDNKICLKESISNIINNTNNNDLYNFCNNYLVALENGKKDSVLLESFISGVSGWNYLNAVDTELSAIAKRINNYKQDIDFTKIINTMKETNSAYLVPLIEEVVLDYVNDKTASKRAILKDRLMCFHHDAYVADMLNILYHDKSISESAKSLNIDKNITLSNVYSPIFMVNEHETVFNINGTYYSRKGNNISKLNRNDTNNLDESFKTLCNILNNNYISFNDNGVNINYNGNVAVISEGQILINDVNFTSAQLNESMNISYITNDGNVNFYSIINYINENFDNIAHIDFAKHITLNNNTKRSIDLFKLKESYYLTTHDEIGHHTFYRNINPMQTSNIMNEHMQMNVSSIFEDLQPNHKKIKNEIDETRHSYEEYINELEERKAQLESCKESCDKSDLKDIEEALKIVEDELENAKKDYNEYQKTSDEFLNGPEGEDDSDIPSIDDGDDSFDYNETDETPNDDMDDADADVSYNSNLNEPLSDEGAPVEYDGLFDETPVGDTVEDEYAPKVVKVSYKSNIKTGTVNNSGEVHILIPSVNSDGDVTNELQRVTFTLDSNRNPIINNEYMPVAIYNIIKNAIDAEPATQEVDVDIIVDEPAQPEDVVNVVSDIEDENPIDVAYDTTDIETENPDAEPEDIEIDIDNIDNNDVTDDTVEVDNIEPTATDDPEPMDLEANDTVNKLIDMELDYYDLDGEGVSIDKFKKFLTKNNIAFNEGDGNMHLYIRNAQDSQNVKRFFTDFEDWADSDFYDFFHELKVYESCSNKLVVRYSPTLENVLESNKLDYKISKRGDKIMIMNAINEGVLITVTDDKTGKIVKINTDELDQDSETKEHEDNTQDDVTFDDSNSEDDNASTEDNASDDTENKNESTESEPRAKKFTFRVKKNKTDESLGLSTYSSKLNESDETVEVADVVKYKGKTGNVISKLNNGDVIVQIEGQTEQIRPSQVRITNSELKVTDVNESVKCGIYMNNYCITPDNCLTNVNNYNNANDNDIITVIVEGVEQSIAKKYVKIS